MSSGLSVEVFGFQSPNPLECWGTLRTSARAAVLREPEAIGKVLSNRHCVVDPFSLPWVPKPQYLRYLSASNRLPQQLNPAGAPENPKTVASSVAQALLEQIDLEKQRDEVLSIHAYYYCAEHQNEAVPECHGTRYEEYWQAKRKAQMEESEVTRYQPPFQPERSKAFSSRRPDSPVLPRSADSTAPAEPPEAKLRRALEDHCRKQITKYQQLSSNVSAAETVTEASSDAKTTPSPSSAPTSNQRDEKRWNSTVEYWKCIIEP